MKRLRLIPLMIPLVSCGILSSPERTSNGTADGRIPLSATEALTPMKYTSGPFTLTIFSPADDAVVREPQTTLSGEVSSDAVVTVNDETDIIARGPFRLMLYLEEGLNAIQIVASDMDGNQVEAVLAVTYEP